MKLSTILTCGAVLASLLGCGCLYHADPLPVTEYDLPLAEGNQRTAIPLRIGVIRNLSGAGHIFLLRGKNGHVCEDESRRWLLSPETMVERELRRAFLSADIDNRKSLMLDAAITRFDINETDGRFNFSIVYIIRQNGIRTPFLFQTSREIENNDIPTAAEKCLAESTLALEGKLLPKGKK